MRIPSHVTAFGLAIVMIVCAVPARAQNILVTADAGKAWDPLIGANPIFLLPSEHVLIGIQAMNNPFNPPAVTTTVRFEVECCKDMLTRTPVTPAGLTVSVVPVQCDPRRPALSIDAPPPRPPLDLSSGPREAVLPACPASSGANASLSPTASAQAYLLIRTSGSPAPGGYVATIRADYPGGTSQTDVFVNVLAPYPGDGPAPACPPSLTLMSLGSINPTPYAWKRTKPAATSYTVGVAFSGPATGAGLEFSVVSPGGTGPIPRNVAVVTFKNNGGRPVAMRTSNSGNCAAPGQQIIVAAGQTRTLSFSTASTTTLVFAKSTCRAWVDMFDCWGGSALGLDDIVAFTQGPFWPLFGGRKVDIQTVGDWGALPRPNSIATITTQ